MIVPEHERGGFELWEGFESGFLLNDPWLHGTRIPRPEQFRGYQADILCDRAASWLAGTRRPAFCMVSLEAPHPPYDAPVPPPRRGAPPPDPGAIVLRGNVPRGGAVEEKARRELAGYYAHVEATDRAIGGLLGAVGDATIVVFTSVHGDMHGSHGLFRKGWPHEESVRVPLLVRGAPEGPALPAPGTASLIDLSRWTLSWAGMPALVPVRPGSFQRISMPSVVRQPHQCDRPWRGVRTPARKLVLNDDGSPWLYFDLERDPLEMSNLAADPGRAREIAALQPAI
jgi:arylsulfatase A-like enzyme